MTITDACEPVICDFCILHIYWLVIDFLDGLGFRHSVSQNAFSQNLKLSHVLLQFQCTWHVLWCNRCMDCTDNFVVPLRSSTDIMKAIFSTVMLQIIHSRSYFLSTIILVFVILPVQFQPLNCDNVITIQIDSPPIFSHAHYNVIFSL